jgi:serine/threonine-protein kinase HipA
MPEGIMEKDVFVYMDLDGVAHLVGRLWARVRKNKEGATFEYDDTWLQNPKRFSLEPALKVGADAAHGAPGRRARETDAAHAPRNRLSAAGG